MPRRFDGLGANLDPQPKTKQGISDSDEIKLPVGEPSIQKITHQPPVQRTKPAGHDDETKEQKPKEEEPPLVEVPEIPLSQQATAMPESELLTDDKGKEIDASDGAVQLAKEKNVPLKKVKDTVGGRGPKGRIYKEDVEEYLEL